MAITKKDIITSVDKNAEKLEHSCIAGGNIKWYTHIRNNLAVPQQVKHRRTMSAIPILGLHPRDMKILRSHENPYLKCSQQTIHNNQKSETVYMHTN